ncbi:MAG: hypothetical protein R3B09_14940 [Nannocystaceae bacterium]
MNLSLETCSSLAPSAPAAIVDARASSMAADLDACYTEQRVAPVRGAG